jgi:ABC-type proline/glycine betaine transport system permease subunit
MDKETIAATAGKISYVGSGGAVFFGMTANEFAAIGGLCIGVVGLLINLVFKWLNHLELKKRNAKLKDYE